LYGPGSTGSCVDFPFEISRLYYEVPTTKLLPLAQHCWVIKIGRFWSEDQ